MASPGRWWTPHVDQSVPSELTDMFFCHWVSGYYHHGDVAKRNFDSLSYVLPSTRRVPSIFNMSPEEQQKILGGMEASASERCLLYLFSEQLNSTYRKACFDKATRAALPRMKISAFSGDLTCGPSLAAFQTGLRSQFDKIDSGTCAEQPGPPGLFSFVCSPILECFRS